MKDLKTIKTRSHTVSTEVRSNESHMRVRRKRYATCDYQHQDHSRSDDGTYHRTSLVTQLSTFTPSIHCLRGGRNNRPIV